MLYCYKVFSFLDEFKRKYENGNFDGKVKTKKMKTQRKAKHLPKSLKRRNNRKNKLSGKFIETTTRIIRKT